ncbi:hypothetical protein [Desulfolutivibrio sulfoxidireducens]|uniref:hypothetical protein n=1 Tax=Desulfolutivibrio sulfoxidireducens TaxID=2773299 RepID=UPI00159E0831|nr:hypothetical protein [Desulfolutivibrio sulfoxidireducens]QLA17632.1 hypothetical protein GD605_16880 [Desulfolutivibrio sulfoxidireducens]
MKMIDAIRQNYDLCAISRECCSENKISVEIDVGLLNDGFLNHDKIVILKVDAYYSSHRLRVKRTPPSIDCLVVVKCQDGKHNVFLIELKDCSGTKDVRCGEIKKKFLTVIDDFFNNKFKQIFSDRFDEINSVKLWVVTDPLNTSGLTDEQYEKKIKGTAIDVYFGMKPLNVLGKYCLITPILPRQSFPCPVIKAC